MKLYYILACTLIVGTGASAESKDTDAQVGRSYTVTIARELKRPFIGQLGETMIGSVAVQIKRARLGERYALYVTGIRRNRFTGLMQVACRYRRLGDDKTGQCNMPPF